tara:strand:- start:8971 stop:9552 length:582 start_codon:yes stop_codon:yes gene_type:complete
MGARKSQGREFYEGVHSEDEMERYNQGLYAERNDIVLEQLSSCLPDSAKVLDLAAGSWYIAERLIRDDRVQSYTWNDFNTKLVKAVREKISDERFSIDPFDADDSEISLNEFNVFICISLEHIEKDLEILSKLLPGTTVSICSPNFDSKGHVRHFSSMREFKSRYEHLIDVQHEKTYHCKKVLQKYVITGVRV